MDIILLLARCFYFGQFEAPVVVETHDSEPEKIDLPV